MSAAPDAVQAGPVTRTSVAVVATLAVLAAAGASVAGFTSDHVTGELATIALAVPTGLAFIGSGLVARRRRPRNRTGVLLVLVGFAWFLSALPAANQPLVFTIGLALTGLFIGFLAHVLLAFPSGELEARVDRALATAMYALVSVLPFAVLLFDEGDIAGTACEGAECPDNLLATVPAQAVANVLAALYGAGAAALSVAVAVRLALRWRRASPALRASLNPILVTASVLIATFAVQVAADFVSDAAANAVNWFLLVAMLALPLAFLYGLLRPRLTASSRRLARELSEQRGPEDVQAVLRRAVRDPTLELGYRSDDAYVGVDGRPLELAGGARGRATRRIGDAVIVHDAALRDQPELDEVVDAARIALERGLTLRSLETSERRGVALLDAIPDNVFRIRRDGTFLEAHVRRNVGIFGGADAFIGRTIAEVMPREVAPTVLAALEQVLATGESRRVEYELEHDGAAIHLEARIARSGDDEVVAITRDISDLKRNEESLRALAAEQAALTRVAVAVATEHEPHRVFDVVAEEVARVLEGDAANVIRYEREAEGVVVGEWRAPGARSVTVGQRLVFDGPTPVARVRWTGEPVRLDTTEPIAGEAGERLQGLGVRAAVAAPVQVGGRPWGAVVVSSRDADAFAPGAEERLRNFAGLVAVALANAEAREQLAALAQEQAALRRVAVAVAAETDPQHVFQLVTEEVGRLLGAHIANTIRFGPHADEGVVVGAWSDDASPMIPSGARIHFDGPTAVSQVYRTGHASRVDSYDDLEGELAERLRAAGIRSAAAAPIQALGRVWGAVAVSSVEPAAFAAGTESRLSQFAALVALALANAEAKQELAASRARIVRAADEARQRLERNLHDGAQQRLVGLSLALRLAQSKLSEDPAAARALLESASEELGQALEELRELARGLHPAILTDRGLKPALEALAARAPVRVELDGVEVERLPPPVEAAAYYVVAESLTNVAKYAGAQAARVRVDRADGVAVVEVEDDGMGGADPSRGTGLRGLADRVEALEGRLSVSSEFGRGTRVRAEIPLRGGVS